MIYSPIPWAEIEGVGRPLENPAAPDYRREPVPSSDPNVYLQQGIGGFRAGDLRLLR